jgi:hypothetical protein
MESVHFSTTQWTKNQLTPFFRISLENAEVL